MTAAAEALTELPAVLFEWLWQIYFLFIVTASQAHEGLVAAAAASGLVNVAPTASIALMDAAAGTAASVANSRSDAAAFAEQSSCAVPHMQGTQRPRHESESETQLDHGGEAAEAQRENRMQEDAHDTGDHSTDV